MPPTLTTKQQFQVDQKQKTIQEKVREYSYFTPHHLVLSIVPNLKGPIKAQAISGSL